MTLPALRGYQAMIAEMTGITDPAMVALAEELMRVEHPTLDALTRAEFGALAAQAVAGATELADAGLLVMFCNSLGLAVPAI
jgi:uncharacterized ParB-like nuclease family protein